MKCLNCQTDNEYAESNCIDNKYLCYSCKTWYPRLADSFLIKIIKPNNTKSISLNIDMIRIKPGDFNMGSLNCELQNLADTTPVHEVSVKEFYLSKTVITRDFFGFIMKEPCLVNPEKPITMVSWFDACNFCNELSKKEGLEECYGLEDQEVVHYYRANNGYRLPTEAEWEFAATGKEERIYPWGNDEPTEDHSVYYTNNVEEVGKKLKGATPDGVLDMAGNIWEWCWDEYKLYPGNNKIFLPIPEYRIIRGGSYRSEKYSFNASARFYANKNNKEDYIGFRVARSSV